MRVELKLRRRQWAFFGALLLILGIPFPVAIPLFLLLAIADHNAGALVGVVFGSMFGGLWVPAGIAAWRISRSRPAITVTGDTITIEHPGVFVRPLELSRSAVHSVYVRPFEGTRRPPKFEGNAWQRLRQRSRWIDRRGTLPDPLPINAWHCPDLSALDPSEKHNLLIAVANPMPMRDLVRRGLGALSYALAQGITSTGPTKATDARGFFAVAQAPTAGTDGSDGAAGAGRGNRENVPLAGQLLDSGSLWLWSSVPSNPSRIPLSFLSTTTRALIFETGSRRESRQGASTSVARLLTSSATCASTATGSR